MRFVSFVLIKVSDKESKKLLLNQQSQNKLPFVFKKLQFQA
jgi:hypothetical protein